MSRNKIFAIFLFEILLLLTILVQKSIFTHFDLSITIKLQAIFQDSLVNIFSPFSIIGRVEIVSLILLIILLISKKLNKFYVLFFYVMTGVFEQLGKYFINQKGPPIEFLKTNLSLHLPSDSIPHGFYAYPSGHSARTAFVSGILLFVIWKSGIRKELKLIFAFCVLTFDISMFVSRVYLGEHWLTDVIGGGILGFSLVFLVPFLAPVRLKKRSPH